MATHPIADYLATLPADRAMRIGAIYHLARDLAPDATEGMKYAMPALIIDGKGFVSVMSTKKHVGLYPYSGSVVSQFADLLGAQGISTTKGAVQIPDAVEVPVELLAQLLRARLLQLGYQH